MFVLIHLAFTIYFVNYLIACILLYQKLPPILFLTLKLSRLPFRSKTLSLLFLETLSQFYSGENQTQVYSLPKNQLTREILSSHFWQSFGTFFRHRPRSYGESSRMAQALGFWWPWMLSVSTWSVSLSLSMERPHSIWNDKRTSTAVWASHYPSSPASPQPPSHPTYPLSPQVSNKPPPYWTDRPHNSRKRLQFPHNICQRNGSMTFP